MKVPHEVTFHLQLAVVLRVLVLYIPIVTLLTKCSIISGPEARGSVLF